MDTTAQTAYNELYVNDAQKTIAHSFDYAVNKMGYTLEEYAKCFANFKYIELIETGDPHYTCGVSGIELAKIICDKTEIKYGRLPYNPGLEYWTGWIAAYYQWLKNITFKTIFSKFTIEDFIKAYPTFHECNKKRMFEHMDKVIYGDSK